LVLTTAESSVRSVSVGSRGSGVFDSMPRITSGIPLLVGRPSPLALSNFPLTNRVPFFGFSERAHSLPAPIPAVDCLSALESSQFSALLSLLPAHVISYPVCSPESILCCSISCSPFLLSVSPLEDIPIFLEHLTLRPMRTFLLCSLVLPYGCGHSLVLRPLLKTFCACS